MRIEEFWLLTTRSSSWRRVSRVLRSVAVTVESPLCSRDVVSLHISAHPSNNKQAVHTMHTQNIHDLTMQGEDYLLQGQLPGPVHIAEVYSYKYESSQNETDLLTESLSAMISSPHKLRGEGGFSVLMVGLREQEAALE